MLMTSSARADEAGIKCSTKPTASSSRVGHCETGTKSFDLVDDILDEMKRQQRLELVEMETFPRN
jgi:hypothetical protein